MMVDTPKDNVILFPKLPKQRKTPEQQQLDKKREEIIRVEHNKVYVQAISEDITKQILLQLKDEGLDLSNEMFLKDYKFFTESLKSLLMRQLKLKHPFQPRVDKSVTTRGKGKDLYAITIDYEKF
mgnify:FL=1